MTRKNFLNSIIGAICLLPSTALAETSTKTYRSEIIALGPANMFKNLKYVAVSNNGANRVYHYHGSEMSDSQWFKFIDILKKKKLIRSDTYITRNIFYSNDTAYCFYYIK